MSRQPVNWDARAEAVAIAIAKLYDERRAEVQALPPALRVAGSLAGTVAFRSSAVAAAVVYPRMFDVTRVGRVSQHKVNRHLRAHRLHAYYANGWFSVAPNPSSVGAPGGQQS